MPLTGTMAIGNRAVRGTAGEFRAYNPATGEKIYEVIRPMTDPSPATVFGHPVVTGGGEGDQLSLKDITVRVNGKSVDPDVPQVT